MNNRYKVLSNFYYRQPMGEVPRPPEPQPEKQSTTPREDIIRMAREAGWPSMAIDNLPGTEDMARLERFAALVAAKEREECAKVCDEYAKYSSNPMNFAENCAAAIRARGQA